MAKSIDAQIRELADTAIRDHVFPGCQVGYILDGKATVLPFGRLTYDERSSEVTADTVYDVASITKSIPTSCLMLHLLELGLLSLDDRLVDYIPEVRNEYADKILIRHLLTYTVVFDLPGGLSAVAKEHPNNILDVVFSAPLVAPPGTKYVYTNAPALLMGLVIERVMNKPLNECANDVYTTLPMPRTSFSSGWNDMKLVAPTEIDWRGEVRGAVHDEGAWALRQAGQVAGNAGLFSTASDLLVFAQMLLNDGEYDGLRYYDEKTVEMMHTNQIPKLGAETGLGWELGSALLPAGAGSAQVFGKTGFTGCALVMDPERQLAFIYLSNRTYPHRPESVEAIRAFRHHLAKIIYDS